MEVIDESVVGACGGSGEENKDKDSKTDFAGTHYLYLSTTSNFASITSREFDPTITRNSPGSTTNRIS